MGQPDGGIGLVDVLAACSRGAVGIHPHIGRVDVDFNGIVHFGVNEEAAKGGVAAVVGIKGRFAHEAVHAGFRPQEAIGIFAFHLDGGGLDAGNFAIGDFQDFGLESLALAIAQVLAHDHGGPVLGFCAAGACLDINEAVAGVHGVGEHAQKFQVANGFFDGVGIRFYRNQGIFVIFFPRHGEEFACIFQCG